METGTVIKNVDHGVGIIIEGNVNMWGEEVIPAGCRILWHDGDISVMCTDELEVVYFDVMR